MHDVRPLAVALAATTLLSSCASPRPPAAGTPPPSVVAGSPAVLPSGWRWESYGGVQVGVPGDWGWADRGLRLDAWCVRAGDQERPPVVARPGGAVPAIGCPDESTLIKNTGWVVAFGRVLPDVGDVPGASDAAVPSPGEAAGGDGIEERDDRTTVRLAGVEVVLQAPRDLRDRIAATIHRVGTDHNGCAATHPISADPARRPEPAADVATLRDVSSVAACRYEVRRAGAPAGAGPGLISSLRLDGPAARAAIQGVGRAPQGGGPDRPQDCLPEVTFGDEVMVLRVTSAGGASEVVVRYSGCSGRGFDDGAHVRRLTMDALRPLLTGPNTPPPLDPEIDGTVRPSGSG